MGDEEARLDRSRPDAREPLDEGQEPLPEEFANPPGVGYRGCDAEEGEEQDEACELEATAGVKDMALEETKPGFGIPGFEGEEVGGG